jgi:hypothetical protein
MFEVVGIDWWTALYMRSVIALFMVVLCGLQRVGLE